MDYQNKLFQMAAECRLRAYAPYSEFAVGAAILCNRKIYTGCNVENVSYPCGTCAESGAISAMVADGGRKIEEILIVADSENIVPCGNCLQKIYEFGTADTLVHSADLKGNIRTYKLSQLLPHNFNAKEVKNA